jgi:hypothetical protein
MKLTQVRSQSVSLVFVGFWRRLYRDGVPTVVCRNYSGTVVGAGAGSVLTTATAATPTRSWVGEQVNFNVELLIIRINVIVLDVEAEMDPLIAVGTANAKWI